MGEPFVQQWDDIGKKKDFVVLKYKGIIFFFWLYRSFCLVVSSRSSQVRPTTPSSSKKDSLIAFTIYVGTKINIISFHSNLLH